MTLKMSHAEFGGVSVRAPTLLKEEYPDRIFQVFFTRFIYFFFQMYVLLLLILAFWCSEAEVTVLQRGFKEKQTSSERTHPLTKVNELQHFWFQNKTVFFVHSPTCWPTLRLTVGELP